MNLNLGDTRLIIGECANEGLSLNQAAYVLATAYWETARTMKPVRETLAKSDAQAIARLDRAWIKGQLKWVRSPYWRGGFFGRGYVQLTHMANYDKAGAKIGVDLVARPDKALQADVAAKILVKGSNEGWFTGKKLSDYITEARTDWVNARRIINGKDKASTIAKLAGDYATALAADGYRPGRKTASKNGSNWLSALIEALLALFRR